MRGRGYLLTVMDQINLFQDGVTEGASADAKNAFVNNLTQETEQQDDEILAKHEPAPVEAPVGAVVLGKGISDAVKMKVLVAAVAAKQSPPMVEAGSSSEPAVQTASTLHSHQLTVSLLDHELHAPLRLLMSALRQTSQA